MSVQGWFEVGVHGKPDPDEHPWVCYSSGRRWSPPTMTVRTRGWHPTDRWFPVSAPPTEPAPTPEPEWVEVDGQKWRVKGSSVQVSSPGLPDGKWRDIHSVDTFTAWAKIAAALGLVDESPVPQSLIDWLRQSVEMAEREPGSPMPFVRTVDLLGMIEAGEFGPVEVRWVTDRLPTESEYPVACKDRGGFVLVDIDSDDWDLQVGDSWVSLSDLLGDR